MLIFVRFDSSLKDFDKCAKVCLHPRCSQDTFVSSERKGSTFAFRKRERDNKIKDILQSKDFGKVSSLNRVALTQPSVGGDDTEIFSGDCKACAGNEK